MRLKKDVIDRDNIIKHVMEFKSFEETEEELVQKNRRKKLVNEFKRSDRQRVKAETRGPQWPYHCIKEFSQF